jgi:hypothetical protein
MIEDAAKGHNDYQPADPAGMSLKPRHVPPGAADVPKDLLLVTIDIARFPAKFAMVICE